MARINIEDSIYRDPRFLELAMKMGSIDTAIGALVRVWSEAQKWYLTPERMIPLSEWNQRKLPMAVIEVGLAEQVGEKVRVCGSDTQFKWLAQRQNAGRENKGKFGERNRTESNGIERNESSSSSSFSSSFSSSSSDSLSKTNTRHMSHSRHGAAVKVPTGLFIANYIQAYRQRYGEKSRPALVGKVQGQIKRFLGEVAIERACDLIQVYLQMDDPWFKTKCHDFGTFLENLNKIGLALDTGQSPDAKQSIADMILDFEKQKASEGGAHQ